MHTLDILSVYLYLQNNCQGWYKQEIERPVFVMIRVAKIYKVVCFTGTLKGYYEMY